MKKTKILIISLLLATLLSPISAGRAQEENPIYIVQEGDTLSAIARTFGSSVEALLQANSITDPNSITPGQELQVPGFSGVQGILSTQEIAAGQSLHFLAAQSRSDPAQLGRLNRLLHPGRLYIGQSVILPEGSNGQPNGASSIKTHLVSSSDNIQQFAAAAGANPWSIASRLEGDPRLWWVPGEWALIPAGETDSNWMPAGVSNLSIQPSQAAQGQTVVVNLTTTEELEVNGQLAQWELNFVGDGTDQMVALQGIHALQEPGLYDLAVTWGNADNRKSTGFQQPYPIRTGNYGFDPVLIVPEETLGPENTEPEDKLIADLVAQVTPDKLWRGPFGWPSAYYVESFPSVFGTRRNYNNTGYNAYHTGLDFYGGVGIEILAPEPGMVVLSEELVVRGLTTVIDHGWGVYTLYMHQSESMVEAGEMVEEGQVIGLVGASGRVTGAHLHWEIRVGGIPVQPIDWVERAYP